MNTATYQPNDRVPVDMRLTPELIDNNHARFNADSDCSGSNRSPSNKGQDARSQNSTVTSSQTHKRALNIVLVTETWMPDINGVSLSLYQLMQQLASLGHHIHLIRPTQANTKLASEQSNGAACEDLISSELMVKGLPIPRYPDLQFGVPAYTSIKRYLSTLNPDIVHIATEGPLGLAALMASKRAHIAVTTGYHTQFHDFSKHFGLGVIAAPLMAYLKRFHNWSDATCVPSQKTQSDLAALGFKRLKQVGRGIDIERFNPHKRSDELRQSWGAGQQHTVLMMVSRLSPEKGVDVVISSYQALQMQQLHRATKLVIVGDGPDRARLEAMSEGNDDIVFTGTQTKDALAAHYASADAFIFASQVETFGNVVTEAMASGLPVYAFDDAAAGMLVDEHCGALVGLGDIKGFINMVAALPKAQQLKRLGDQARQVVQGMSWAQPARQMLMMFIEAIGCQADEIITDPSGCLEASKRPNSANRCPDSLSKDNDLKNRSGKIDEVNHLSGINTAADTSAFDAPSFNDQGFNTERATFDSVTQATSLTCQLPIRSVRYDNTKVATRRPEAH